MLTTLPPELFFLIIDALDNYREDIYSLAACSRCLYDTLFSRLFSDVHFTSYNANRKNPHFRNFLYAIHRNPKLIDTIRSFSVAYPYTPCLPPTNESLSNINSEVIQASLTAFSEEQREQWVAAAQRRTPNVWLALLILRLKNLQNLVFYSPPTYIKTRARFLRLALQQAASTPIWPCLESATLWFCGPERASTQSEMSFLALFPRIPSIRCLTTHCLGQYERRRELQHTLSRNLVGPPGSSNVTELRLLESRLDPDVLSDLVQSCKSLRTFEYSADPRTSWRQGNYSRCKVPTVLLAQKTTLETLRIHPIGTPLRWSPDVKVPTGSFAPFAALKSLYIGLSDLLGTWGEQRPEPAPPAPAHGSEQDIRDILPLSLKTLWLYCSDDDLFALCIGRLAEVLSQTPGLSDTKITLDGTVAVFEDYFLHTRPEFERTDAQWNLEKLRLLCQERGITLDIRGEPDACESDEAEETDNSDDSEVPDDADLADDADYLDGSRDPTYRDCSENEDDTEDEDDMRWSNKAMSYAAPAGGHGARATVLFFPQ